MTKKQFLIILAIMVFTLSSCMGTPRAIEGAERDAVLEYAEPLTDNLLAALNANDYQVFIRDFDETMLKATTPENFANLQSLIASKLGKYESREISTVTAIGAKTVVVIYTARFANEESVTVRVTFQSGDAHLITGLWFDSPKLREQ